MTRRHISFGLCLLTCLALGSGLTQTAAPPASPSAADRDRDGYLDAAELVGQDRANFASWFAAIAESQYYGISAD